MSACAPILKKFSELLNAEFSAGVSPDAWGVLNLQVGSDRQVAISLSPDQNDLVFCTMLCELDRPTDTVMFTAALACNLHQERTRGGAIGLDAEYHALVFSWRVQAEQVDPATLLVCLDSFVQTANGLAKDIRAEVDAMTPEERDQIELALDRRVVQPSAAERYMSAARIP